MAKVIVSFTATRIVVESEHAAALVNAYINAERFEQRYTNGGYLTIVKNMSDSIELTPLSDEHYKIYKIAGEQE